MQFCFQLSFFAHLILVGKKMLEDDDNITILHKTRACQAGPRYDLRSVSGVKLAVKKILILVQFHITFFPPLWHPMHLYINVNSVRTTIHAQETSSRS